MGCVRVRRGKLVIDYYDENKNRHIIQVKNREEGNRRLKEI